MRYSTGSLLNFFFEAARHTYAGSGQILKEGDLEFPSLRRYRFEQGGLLYVDEYDVNGERSGGQTKIYEDGVLVWLMQYHGWCQGDDLEVLKFLKQALFKAYAEENFNGGRGPRAFSDPKFGDLRYLCISQPPFAENGFERFCVRETIRRRLHPTEEIFWHRCHGMLLR